MNIWNSYKVEEESGKPIKIPFGRWPWNDKIDQVFREKEARKIAEELNAEVEQGEPGIPVYAGHPDVPELAAKYPDKGALGWIKKIEVGENGVKMSVEWDRYPGKGFAWFSPYWCGETTEENGKVVVTVSGIRSIGLVNRPNIHAFRLPNEEAETSKTEEELMKEILRMLGLPETATVEEAMGAIGKLKGDAENCAAEKAKAEAVKVALEDECKKVKASNEEMIKKLGEMETKLANSEADAAKAKADLANEQAELMKIKSLKTQSVTAEIANEKHETDNRLELVNEIMNADKVDFDTAWCRAKNKKPELFK